MKVSELIASRKSRPGSTALTEAVEKCVESAEWRISRDLETHLELEDEM